MYGQLKREKRMLHSKELDGVIFSEQECLFPKTVHCSQLAF